MRKSQEAGEGMDSDAGKVGVGGKLIVYGSQSGLKLLTGATEVRNVRLLSFLSLLANENF